MRCGVVAIVPSSMTQGDVVSVCAAAAVAAAMARGKELQRLAVKMDSKLKGRGRVKDDDANDHGYENVTRESELGEDQGEGGDGDGGNGGRKGRRSREGRHGGNMSEGGYGLECTSLPHVKGHEPSLSGDTTCRRERTSGDAASCDTSHDTAAQDDVSFRRGVAAARCAVRDALGGISMFLSPGIVV